MTDRRSDIADMVFVRDPNRDAYFCTLGPHRVDVTGKEIAVARQAGHIALVDLVHQKLRELTAKAAK